MAQKGPSFRETIPQNDNQCHRRQIKANPINEICSGNEGNTIKYYKNLGIFFCYNAFWYFSLIGTRVYPVVFYIRPPVKGHGSTSGKDHTKQNLYT